MVQKGGGGAKEQYDEFKTFVQGDCILCTVRHLHIDGSCAGLRMGELETCMQCENHLECKKLTCRTITISISQSSDSYPQFFHVHMKLQGSG